MAENGKPNGKSNGRGHKKKYWDKTLCCYDHGTFIELARTLSKDFGKVLYYSPWEASYPRSNAALIGHGVDGITRINNIWSALPEIDIFLFPDVYDGALQAHLVSIGKLVFGSRHGEDLELLRVAAKKHQEALGIDIGPYTTVKGIDALREYLKEHDNCFVKVDKFRGDFETFRSLNYRLVEPLLDQIAHTLGAKKAITTFTVEDAIEPAVEVGYDGFVIDGKVAKNALYGIEVKDKGYVGRTKKYDELPEQVRYVNEKLENTLRDYQYRGFWSTEVRITKDGRAYNLDNCARAGSPPNEAYQLLIENIAEVVYEGANGVVVEPKYRGKWAAELLIHSSWAERNWQAVEFPKKFRENIKLRQLAQIDDRLYCIPDVGGGAPEIGAVVAYADTMEDAIRECRTIAEAVSGHYVEVMPDALDSAQEEIQKLAEFGITF